MLPLVNRLKSQLLNHLFKIINLIKDHIVLPLSFVFFFYINILQTNTFLSKSNIITKPTSLYKFRELYIRRVNLSKEKIVKISKIILKDLNVLLLKLGIGQFFGARKLQSGDLVFIIDFLKIKKHIETRKSK